MNAIPLSLYIHFPWCIQKCPYCDFNSHAAPKHLPSQDYITALIRNFKSEMEGNTRSIQSIFMGGGTPSLFHSEALKPLFEVILPYCIPEVEITLEANPGTIERGQFKDYFDLGINRISLGVQSMNEVHLKKLGRIHNVNEVEKAVFEIYNAGFTRLNLDLMHGLPNQTLSDALMDLEKALALAPTHLSWYQLTIEPNTYFASYPPTLPHDDDLAEIETEGFALLQEHGFERYEISAFSRNQDYCKHNLNYWEFGDYIGIGAGAHGKISEVSPEAFHITRTTQPKLPQSYLHMNSDKPRNVSLVPLQERPFEFMMNALRLNKGFAKSLFEARTGLPLESIRDKLEAAKLQGLLTESDAELIPTALGFRFLNDLLRYFL